MKPITREEMYLAAAAGYDVMPPEPVTRKEMFLAKLAGMEVETPVVFTRQERFLEEAAVALSRSVIEPLEVTENGTYTAPDGVDGYSPVTVAVPKPEIKLQDKTITENGTYTADSGFDGLGMVEVNIKGGGGGLPVGGYWGPFEDVPRPNGHNWVFAELGGELYAFTPSNNVETNTGISYKFKMVNGAWEQLADETFADASMYYICFRELNGKLHFIPKTESSYHWIFDGTALVKMANLPKTIDQNQMFIQDGKLKLIKEKDVYVWDEANDTWSIEATISGFYSYPHVFTDGGVVYMVYMSKLYIYANKTATLYCDFPESSLGYSNSPVVMNHGIYYYKRNSLDGETLYFFDFATKTNRIVTKIPTQLSSGACYLTGYKGKLLSLPAKPTNVSIFQLYEVTE